MNTALKISEAASIALHTVVILAADTERYYSTREVAERLSVSEAHLSKVLQRLARVGLVKSVRGPKGGFKLDKPGEKVTLLNVFEAIEGPFRPRKCLMDKKTCKGKNCVMGQLLEKVNSNVRDYLRERKLSEFNGLYA